MSFTYDLTTTTGKVRLNLGDVHEGVGLRPDGSNLTDEELAVFLTQEKGVVMGAIAAACEALANEWTAQVSMTVGSRSDQASLIAAHFQERAVYLRRQNGGLNKTLTLGLPASDA